MKKENFIENSPISGINVKSNFIKEKTLKERAKETQSFNRTEPNKKKKKENEPAVHITLDHKKTGMCNRYTFNGIDVFFPYEAYDCQKEYMAQVIRALDEKKYAALESPTGTGKTLCLLCASLGWLSYQRSKGLCASTQIFYSSRTHSQLENVIKELKKTPYDPNICLLASRKALCINSSVLTANGNIDWNCKKARAQKSCIYFTGGQQDKTYKLEDIENLKRVGKSERFCPFYQQRRLQENADIIFLPYNYLLDIRFKTSLKILLSDNIVIIDEAHNIDSVCEQSKSMEITDANITEWIKDLNNFNKAMENHFANFKEFDDKNEKFRAIRDFTELDNKNVEVIKQSLENLVDKLVNFNFDRTSEKRIELNDFFNFIWSSTKSKQLKIEFEERQMGGKKSKFFDEEESSLGTVDTKGTKNSKINEKYQINNQEKEKEKLTVGFTPDSLVQMQELCKTVDSIITDVLEAGSTMGGLIEFLNLIKELYSNHRQKIQGTVNEIDYVGNSFKFMLKQVSTFPFKNSNNKNNKKGELIKKICIFCLNPGFGFSLITNDTPMSVILTSGTLSPLEGLESELKILFPIKLLNTHVIDKKQIKMNIISRYPEENLLKGDLNFRNDTKDLPETIDYLGKMVGALSKITPGGVLCFFASFSYLNRCLELWETSGAMIEIKRTKKVFIDKAGDSKDQLDFKPEVVKYKESIQKGNPCIFFSVCRGSSSEGVDFSDDMARLVIIVGIPFPNIVDTKVILKKEYLRQMGKNLDLYKQKGIKYLSENEWFNQAAFRAINQAIGRVIRHVTDYGSICLIDSRYWTTDENMFSKWTIDSIERYNTRKLFADMIKFYSEMKTWVNPKLQKYTDKVNNTNKSLAIINEEPRDDSIHPDPLNSYIDKKKQISNFKSNIQGFARAGNKLNTNSSVSSVSDSYKEFNKKIATYPLEKNQEIKGKNIPNVCNQNISVNNYYFIQDSKQNKKEIEPQYNINSLCSNIIEDSSDIIEKRKNRMKVLDELSKANKDNNKKEEYDQVEDMRNLMEKADLPNCLSLIKEKRKKKDDDKGALSSLGSSKEKISKKKKSYKKKEENNEPQQIITTFFNQKLDRKDVDKIDLQNMIIDKDEEDTSPSQITPLKNNQITNEPSTEEIIKLLKRKGETNNNSKIVNIIKEIASDEQIKELKTEMNLETCVIKEEERGLNCPICFEKEGKEFLVAKCGHTCCEDCWNELLKTKLECPLCKNRTRHKTLTRLIKN